MLLDIICSPQLANSPYAQSGTRTLPGRRHGITPRMMLNTPSLFSLPSPAAILFKNTITQRWAPVSLQVSSSRTPLPDADKAAVRGNIVRAIMLAPQRTRLAADGPPRVG